MRLSQKEQRDIISTFKNCFKEDDHLWVFGSRIDPQKKGGDIDLYVETHENDTKTALLNRLKFSGDLKEKIGDQKIDIVLNVLSKNYHLPIYKIARAEGIKLV